ncbi:putative O-methyltransferase [Xylariales sp. AK1849]|nr:putative O-methyltransferase [Xylariales sp. AK1849]
MASIDAVASSITDRVSKLSSLLQQTGIAPPTLDEAGFGDFAQETDTPTGNAIRETRNHIIDAAQDLLRLVRGPTDQILSLTWSVTDTANLDLITRLKIPQHVPIGASISLQELAKDSCVPVKLVSRVVRYAVANGVFVEEAPEMIRHSASSAALAHDAHLRDIVHFATEFLGVIAVKVPEAVLLKRDDADNAPHTAFNLAYRTDQSLFEYFATNEDLTDKYHKYLAGRVQTPLWSVDRLRSAWPWASAGEVTVVDIGGSSGHTVQHLAPLMPAATFIVQDSNLSAMEMGKRDISSSGLQSRITFMEYDFFTPQPVRDADIYIYRHILHDWNDEDSVRILSSLIPALKPGARVFISEGILPLAPAKPANTLASKMIRIEDMIMLAAHDAHERSVSDFESLFQQAAPGAFRLAGVTSGKEAGAFQSLLEFEFVGSRG